MNALELATASFDTARADDTVKRAGHLVASPAVTKLVAEQMLRLGLEIRASGLHVRSGNQPSCYGHEENQNDQPRTH